MRLSRISSSVFLSVVVVTALLFPYFLYSLSPISKQLIENQRDILFNYVSDASSKILKQPNGLSLLKVYLIKFGRFSTHDIVNIQLEDTHHKVIWATNTKKSTYWKTAVLDHSLSSGKDMRYFLTVFFEYDKGLFFSIPWLSLATLLFLGFFTLYELLVSFTNSGLSLSRWCYQENLSRWAEGDFSRLAFMPSHYSDQSTKKQMFYVQSINEIFSFIKRRCSILENSAGSLNIIDSCRNIVKNAQKDDLFCESYLSVQVAWAPMTEVRFLTLLLSFLLGSLVYSCHDNVAPVLACVFPSLFVGVFLSNLWGYRYSRRFLSFCMGCLIWTGLIFFFRYKLLGIILVSLSVGFLCHALSLEPREEEHLTRWIRPEHEKLLWPICPFLIGFFIPPPLFYTLSTHSQGDWFGYLPVILTIIISSFLWYYTYRHPVWRCSLLPLKGDFSFFHVPSFVFLFFFFMAGGLFYIVFSENSYFLAAWFIFLGCVFKMLSYIHEKLILRRLLFIFLGLFVLLLPFLSGFFRDVFSNDGLVFLASLISGYFVKISDKRGELIYNVFSPLALLTILLGIVFFFSMDHWGFVDLALATLSIGGGILVWHYGEHDYAH